MICRVLPLLPALLLLAPGAALADSVGRWLYDDRGEIIGSVKSLSPDGRTAVVVLGVYFHTGARSVEVPAGALRAVDGGTTPRAETLQALLNAPARGGQRPRAARRARGIRASRASTSRPGAACPRPSAGAPRRGRGGVPSGPSPARCGAPAGA